MEKEENGNPKEPVIPKNHISQENQKESYVIKGFNLKVLQGRGS
jgi:hypothetical protein